MTAMRARLVEAGIGWTALAYHKTPSVPATAFDIVQGRLSSPGRRCAVGPQCYMRAAMFRRSWRFRLSE